MAFGVGREGLGGFADPVGDLRHTVDAVGALDPAGMADAELQGDLVRLARQRDRQDAAFAAWTLAAVRRGIGVADGYADTIGWLAWKTCRPRAEIRRIVRLAELAELLAETGAAWAAGEITTAAVELIAAARVAGCDEELAAMEPEFLERARRGARKDLQILTQHFTACARADGSKPAPPDTFTVAEVGDRGALRADLSKASCQTVRETLEKFTRPPAADDGTSLAVRQAEALVRICEVALDRGPHAEGARPVVSYLTHRRTVDDPTHPLTLGLFGGVIDPRERDRILCDATVVPVTTGHLGEILDVGRATPVWNRAQRRAVTHRSPHCGWPGCEVPAPWCDIHHLVHWEHGGETSIRNGEHLCRRHHVFVHRHPDWTCTFEGQQLRVHRPDGSELHPDPWADMVRAV